MNDRAYSATRNRAINVMRERNTPRVIDPAIKAIVTIAPCIGTTPHVQQTFSVPN